MDETMRVSDFDAIAQLPPETPLGDINRNIMVATYHQASEISPEDHDDWRHSPAVQVDYAQAREGLQEEHTIHDKYHVWGKVLYDCWGCSINECLPKELRSRTPYSLALVAHVADLAIVTAGEMERAQRILLQQCRARQNGEGGRYSANAFVVSRSQAFGIPAEAYVEEFIKECPNGITLEDVSNTMAAATASSTAYAPYLPDMEPSLNNLATTHAHNDGAIDGRDFSIVGPSAAPRSTGLDRNKLGYHQAEHISPEDVNDWHRLRGVRASAKKNMAPKGTPQRMYHKFAVVIERSWGCSVAECLPPELQMCTPYSLALVGRMAKLAGLTDGDVDLGHRVLRHAWSTRQQMEGDRYSSTRFIRLAKPAKKLAHQKCLERHIDECPRGVMMQDVLHAMDLVKSAGNPFGTNGGAVDPGTQALQREQRFQKRQGTTGKPRKGHNKGTVAFVRAHASVEENVASDPGLQQYIREKEYEAYRRGYQDAVDGKQFTASAGVVSPVGQKKKDHEKDDNDDEDDDDDDDDDDEDDDGGEPNTNLTIEHVLRDEKNAAQMSCAMNVIAMQDRRGGKQAKHNARRALRSNALPLERFDLNQLPQLPLPSFDAGAIKMETED
ncbi:uncharacterized protein MYCGRDRAFT_89117 [Zymoseptoria tritici IPO323]|uniref:Uncharacterized protein n=1 Tax=Zymoseptoria tritici (strain CBS 115943 / IPO323) TaxID=336722 RepID=F9WZ01_ZYMTI|nr:uncharacterized protein MYCGRDRAFT_89117 [Zymoseptoria tritici IPO323]EGP91105.1 hypothetical protein MYCGRDRAFT_89117 [Zymoseptoria tritici IPO323]